MNSMHIRSHYQLEKLSRVDYVRWRDQVRTEIAISLADRFTTAEIARVEHMAMSIVRAGYHLNELTELETRSISSDTDHLAYSMADHLRITFHQVELVHMDGYYSDIFLNAGMNRPGLLSQP